MRLALLGLVLSAPLVAQAGELPVVHVPGFGLALGASTEGAEGLSGEFEQGILAELMTAGGADHLAALHIADVFDSSVESVFVMARLVSETINDCDDVPFLFRAEPLKKFVNGADYLADFQRDTSGAALANVCLGVAIDFVMHFRVADDAAGVVGMGHVGSFLSRDIPPVPQSLDRGRGERSLAVRGHRGHVAEHLLNRPDQDAVSTFDVSIAPNDAIAGSVGLFDVGPNFAAGGLAHGLALLGSDGVDVFHELSMAQALAQVNRNKCGIFAGMAA